MGGWEVRSQHHGLGPDWRAPDNGLRIVPREWELHANISEYGVLRLPFGRLEQHANVGRQRAESYFSGISNDVRYLPYDDGVDRGDV